MTDLDNKSSHQTISREIEVSISKVGLDIKTIRQHQTNVQRFLTSQTPRYFPIIDTCRIDNGGIKKLPALNSTKTLGAPIVAFVPAAGASSRYLQALVPLMAALHVRDRGEVVKAIDDLDANGILNCPLPTSISELVKFVRGTDEEISKDLAHRVLGEIESPKALYPAVIEGDTFLELKREEHARIGGFAGEVYVCPPGRVSDFKKYGDRVSARLPMTCFEQGPDLATVRFDNQARVVCDDEGQPSMVPAGHGSLLRLMPKVLEEFPGARGVFIRNIDNIAGTQARVIDSTRNFIDVFKLTLANFDKIRESLRENDFKSAESLAAGLMEFWGGNIQDGASPLEALLIHLFHENPGISEEQYLGLMERPLVLMGQVPNTSHDVGGTCVFTEVNGKRQKLCLEVPHASPDDKKNFLEDSRKSTHFNPVFVVAEIPSTKSIEQWDDHPYWLVSRKSWRGRDVYYQESILYEMLGSSDYCNVVFVEIPRLLFNPHKSLKDASNKKRAAWIVG